MNRFILAPFAGALVALASGLSLTAANDNDDEVPPDEPVRLEANLFQRAIRLSAADGIMDSGASWGHSSPWLVDVDGDGIRDLVVGDFSGLFRFYRNEGTNQQPRYAKAVNLQAGGVDAKVPIY